MQQSRARFMGKNGLCHDSQADAVEPSQQIVGVRSSILTVVLGYSGPSMAILHQLSQVYKSRRRGPRHAITGVHVDCLGDYMRTLGAADDNNIEVPI